MTHETLAEIAALAGAAGAALVILGRPQRLQLAAGLILVAAAEAMLIVALLPATTSSGSHRRRESPHSSWGLSQQAPAHGPSCAGRASCR